jgi:energy-coupling factor transporter ATP-binding protein EcfA2
MNRICRVQVGSGGLGEENNSDSGSNVVISPSRFNILVGPNGSGKSTVIEALAKLLQHDQVWSPKDPYARMILEEESTGTSSVSGLLRRGLESTVLELLTPSLQRMHLNNVEDVTAMLGAIVSSQKNRREGLWDLAMSLKLFNASVYWPMPEFWTYYGIGREGWTADDHKIFMEKLTQRCRLIVDAGGGDLPFYPWCIQGSISLSEPHPGLVDHEVERCDGDLRRSEIGRLARHDRNSYAALGRTPAETAEELFNPEIKSQFRLDPISYFPDLVVEEDDSGTFTPRPNPSVWVSLVWNEKSPKDRGADSPLVAPTGFYFPHPVILRDRYLGIDEHVEYGLERLASRIWFSCNRSDEGWLDDGNAADTYNVGGPKWPTVLSVLREQGRSGYYIAELNSCLELAARWIGEEATVLLPDFARVSVEIQVSESAPTRNPSSFAIEIVDSDSGARRHLEDMGQGLRKWIEFSLILAMTGLIRGLLDGSDSIEELEELWVEPRYSDIVLLIDEPEAHLHPAAQKSVARWLSAKYQNFAQVFVATHSAEIVIGCSRSEDCTVHQLRLFNGKPQLVKSSAPGEFSNQWAILEEFGIDQSEILMSARCWLFVEGVHDQIILETLCGDRLERAGICVIPLFGSYNEIAILTAPFVRTYANKVVRLKDTGRPDPLREQSWRDFMRESGLTEQSDRFSKVTLKYSDVLYCIPTEAVVGQQEKGRNVTQGGRFPGWQSTYDEYLRNLASKRESGGPRSRKAPKNMSSDWKKFVERQYGIDLTRDGVKSLAKEAMDMPVDRILKQAIDKIVTICQGIQ